MSGAPRLQPAMAMAMAMPASDAGDGGMTDMPMAADDSGATPAHSTGETYGPPAPGTTGPPAYDAPSTAPSTQAPHKGNAMAILGGTAAGAALLGVGAFLLSRHMAPALSTGFHVESAVVGGAAGALFGGLAGHALTGGSFARPHRGGGSGAAPGGTTGAGVTPPFANAPKEPSTAKVPETVTGVVADRSKPAAPGGPKFSITAIDAKLDTPVQVTSTPSDPDHLYVVQQGGTIVRTKLDGTGKETFADISSVVQAGGEQGLLSVAFHPDFAHNGRLFVDYTGKDGGATHVAELTVGSNGKVDPGTRKDLLTIAQPYANHNGGQLQFGPDGDLYIGMGDGGGGGDTEMRAQDPNDLLGKILRIDVDHAAAGSRYGIPYSNPFSDGAQGRPEIYATGVRNPWRFSFDRSNGDMWIGDVGQNTWEEVDYLPRGTGAGANLGWSSREGANPFGDHPVGPGRPVDPVLQYGHDEGAAITGGFVYRGSKVPSLQGYYVYADYAASEIRALKVEDGKVTDRRAFPSPDGSISSFGEDARGELYATTLQGQLFSIGAEKAGGATGPTGPTGPGASATQEVQLGVTGENLKFDRSEVHVKAGHVKLDLKNDGSMYHNIGIQGNGVHVESGMIRPGKSGSVEADLQPGTYTYFCAPHFYAGMTGTLVVDPA